MGYPVCLVDIYGEEKSWTVAAASGGIGSVDSPHGSSPGGDLIACRTEKRLSVDAPAGVFELTLMATRDTDGRRWDDKISPQDLVVIQMMNNQGSTQPETGAGELHTVMIGFVDTISETTEITSQDLPRRVIQVRGRDFGKLFISGMVTYWSFAGAEILGLRHFIDAAHLNAQPHVVVERLLEDLFERFMRIGIRKGGLIELFWNFFAYRLQSYGTEIPGGLDYQFLGGEGSWWSFLYKIASPPFHELFIDTRRVRETIPDVDATGMISKAPSSTLGRDGSAPTLILRPTPFPHLTPPSGPVPPASSALASQTVTNEAVVLTLTDLDVTASVDAWNGLVRHEVGVDHLVGEPFEQQLSRSDAEQFNTYLVFPVIAGLSEKQWLLHVAPVVDRRKFQRYGYKLFMPETRLLQAPNADSPADPWFGFYRALTWRLASWNVLNDRFLSGQKTFMLLPHVHVGERLLDRSDWQQPREFYIESVIHRFEWGARATTTLGLTRGLPVSDYEQYGTLLTGAGLESPSGIGEVRDFYRQLIDTGQRPPQ